MTNYERIKAMSVEEMAKFFSRVECYECPFAVVACPTFSEVHCEKLFTGWLESEVDT